MKDNDPKKIPRHIRLERTFAQIREERHRRTTVRLLWVIAALMAALALVLLRRYGSP